MKIIYKNTMQDIIDFTLYDDNNSSYVKKILIIIIMLIISLGIGNGISLYLIFGRVLPFYIVNALLISILSIIFIPKIHRWVILREVIERVNEVKSKNPFSDTTLILDDEGITRENEFITLRLLWKGVDKVETREDYIFIYTNFTNTIIIPFKAFDSITEKDIFLKFICKNVDNCSM